MRVLRTEVKPAAQAEAEYHEAERMGHSAAKVKQEPESDIYTVDLGNLNANELCVVRIHYLSLLHCVAGALEWVHTSTWVPPYISHTLDVGSQQKASSAVPTYSKEVSYALSYTVHVYSCIGVRSVESAEAIDVVEGEPGNGCHRVVTLSSHVADPARDFRLLVELAQHESSPLGTLTLQRCQRGSHTKTVGLASIYIPRQQQATLPQNGHDTAVTAGEAASTATTADVQLQDHQAPAPKRRTMLSLFETVFKPMDWSDRNNQHPGSKKELVLVVDCSGSMSGTPIQHAHDAALYFVRDLPMGASIKFQIVLFGTRHKQMNAASQGYEVESERRAVDWISANVHANLGGTEIYDTLRMVYDTPIPEGYERQIIFMTDGGAAWQEKPIEELLQTHTQAAKTTVLSLGIGYGVHRGLVDMMAATTGGLSQYVSSAQDIVRTCSFLKKCALSEDVLLQPRLKPKLCMLRSAPAVLPPRLFAGEQLLVLAEVLKAEEGAALELQAVRRSGEEVCVSIPIPGPSEDLASTAARAEAGTQVYQLEGDAVAALHAMVCIKSLLSGTSALHLEPDGTPVKRLIPQEVIKDQVVKLAAEEGLVTPYTSAVGVLLLADPKDPSKMQQMEVPLKLPEGRTMWASDRSVHSVQTPPLISPWHTNPCPTMPHQRPPPPTSSAVVRNPHIFLRPPMAPPEMPHQRHPPPTMSTVTRYLFPSWGRVGAGRGSSSPAQSNGAGSFYDLLRAVEDEDPSLSSSEIDFPAGAEPSAAEPSRSVIGHDASEGNSFRSAKEPKAPTKEKSKKPSWLEKNVFSKLRGMSKAPSSKSKQETSTQPAAPLPSTAAQEPLPPAAPPLAEAPPPPSPQAAPASAVPGPRTRLSNPMEMLRSLNLSRTIEGYWQTGDSLLEDLLSQRAAREGGKEVKELVVQVKAAKPAALPEDMWTTVLVLAYLRQHLPQERPQWEGMEAKALTWLQAHWPLGGVQSVGACVLSAMKLV